MNTVIQAQTALDKKTYKKAYKLFALALEIGSKTGVKTLDAIHLASAALAGRLYGQKIDCFVTLDEDILKRQEAINPLIESRVTSLNEEF